VFGPDAVVLVLFQLVLDAGAPARQQRPALWVRRDPDLVALEAHAHPGGAGGVDGGGHVLGARFGVIDSGYWMLDVSGEAPSGLPYRVSSIEYRVSFFSTA
jgi:hypothetical protein